MSIDSWCKIFSLITECACVCKKPSVNFSEVFNLTKILIILFLCLLVSLSSFQTTSLTFEEMQNLIFYKNFSCTNFPRSGNFRLSLCSHSPSFWYHSAFPLTCTLPLLTGTMSSFFYMYFIPKSISRYLLIHLIFLYFVYLGYIYFFFMFWY